MTVHKFVNHPCIVENPNAEVWVETGDFGPCVDYSPCNFINDHVEKDLVCDGKPGKGEVYTVKKLVEELKRYPLSSNVTVADWIKAAPFLIKSAEAFAQYMPKGAGLPNTVKDVEKRFGKLKYPIIVIDAE